MAVLGGMNGSGNASSSLGYENPAFKIKIVAPTDTLQQKESQPRRNPAEDSGDNIKEGDPVSAKIGERQVTGTVYAVHKNDQNDVIFVEIKDEEGKVHKVDASRVRSSGSFNDMPDSVRQSASTPGVFSESKFCSYDNFSTPQNSPTYLKSILL